MTIEMLTAWFNVERAMAAKLSLRGWSAEANFYRRQALKLARIGRHYFNANLLKGEA